MFVYRVFGGIEIKWQYCMELYMLQIIFFIRIIREFVQVGLYENYSNIMLFYVLLFFEVGYIFVDVCFLS